MGSLIRYHGSPSAHYQGMYVCGLHSMARAPPDMHSYGCNQLGFLSLNFIYDVLHLACSTNRERNAAFLDTKNTTQKDPLSQWSQAPERHYCYSVHL